MEPDDLERQIFFERAREEAEQAWENDNSDASALTRWGGALLELAHFKQGHDAFDTIDQAVEKFRDALKIDPKKPETLWCIGNAYMSQGFLTTDAEQAGEYFDQAGEAFGKACKEEPKNETYKKALEMIPKAPYIHEQLQKQVQAQEMPLGGGGGGLGERQSGSKSDFWYDVAGWGILLAVGIAWVSWARTEQVAAAAQSAK